MRIQSGNLLINVKDESITLNIGQFALTTLAI